MDDFFRRLKQHDDELDAARILSREFITRVIILCSSAVAFSVSLFSIPIIKDNIDFTIIKYSWFCFVGTIILGFFLLFFEGRVEYVRAYRAFQPTGNISQYKRKFFDHIRIIFIIIFSLFYPTNLVFCRIYRDAEKMNYYQNLNGFIVHYLAKMRGTYFLLENIFIVIFISSLVIFVKGVI